MTRLIFYLVWLALYWYYIGYVGEMEPGIGRQAAAVILAVLFLAAAGAWAVVSGLSVFWLGFAADTGLFLLYDLFFDRESFRHQWRWILAPGAALCLISLAEGLGEASGSQLFLLNGLVLFVFFILSAAKKGYLTLAGGLTVGAVYALLTCSLWLLRCSGRVSMDAGFRELFSFVLVFIQLLILILVENTLFAYKTGFEFRTESFQKEVLGHQYEEIKTIYMNMRGWRHDYHNHIQVIKAYLAAGNLQETDRYLDRLEQDLDQVDTYVKSGNQMIDAILNSKLTLAAAREIRVNCKTEVPETVSVEDIDLCVILGNLLDNALEACEVIPPESRFLRVYIAAAGSQLYLSIQNSAREDLSEGQRRYITNKRGNHGYGMKRVQAMVDKYDGFLNLANEPGVFAAEVRLPL